MKQFNLLFTLLIIGLYGQAQTNVELNIEHLLNDQPFSFNSTAQAPGGYDFSVERLQYYLSEITIIHDGGQNTPVEDTWLLVNAGSTDNFDLGSHNVNTIEGISFYVGVDRDTNNADPSLHPMGHPLAPQNPSMHWGWASGYRFVAMEGNAGPNTQFGFEVHALGNANYNRAEVLTSATDVNGTKLITIYADYARALTNTDVSSGLILHAENTDAGQFLEDFADFVFIAPESLSASETSFNGSFDVYPNPTSKNSFVRFRLGNAQDCSISIYSVDGKLVSSSKLNQTSGVHSLSELSAGSYKICLEKNGARLVSRDLIVTP